MSYLPVDRRKFLKGCAAGAAALATQSATFAMAHTVDWRDASTTEAAGSQSMNSLCGLFNPLSGAMIAESGAQAVRIIISPYVFGNNNNNQLPNDKMELLSTYPSGVPLILSFLWIHASNGPYNVPDPSEWNEWAGWAIGVIQAVNAALPQDGVTMVNIVALDNEPFAQYKSEDLVENDSNPSMLSNAGLWWNNLAQQIATWAATASPNLKISTPAWTDTSTSGYKAAFYKWVAYAASQQYIQYFDFHAHVGGQTDQECLNNLNGYIDQVTPHFNALTVMCTEWSQAKFFTAWLKSKVSNCFANYYNIPAHIVTNEDYITAFSAFGGDQDPTTQGEWDDWMATSGADGNFIPAAYTDLLNGGVSIPCYGGAIQYSSSFAVGSAVFEVDSLYASLTVGPTAANYGFLKWYQKLTNTPITQPIPTDMACPNSKS